MKRNRHGALLWFFLRVLAIRSILAKELTIDIDLEKPVAIADEKFLSLTIDPATLVRGAALSSDFERSTRLAHALRPAYVRLGGPRGTLYRFGKEDPPDNEINRGHLISESDWALVYQWAEKSGLDVIACISAENDERQGSSLDAEEIVSFSDQMGFNASWQLGYECQNRCNASAADLAKRLVVLRETLNAFPRYANSMIVGPDIVAYETRKERQYLQDYFNGAGNALSAITWHPKFDSINSDSEGVLIQPGDLEKEKKDLYKVIGRFMKNRPLWIAESKPEEYKSLYLGALLLARRLGNAARSNVDVIMRQPEDLTQPSPDYWVSLLHKTLVGRQVFDGHVETDENNHVYLYYQCTKSSSRYKPGSITIFGVNFNPEDVEIRLKGAPVTTLHEYLLSPGFDATNRMFSRSVLLNNETLALLNDDVPEMKPIISSNPEGLGISLPSAGVGFWVLPDFKVKSCMEPELSQDPNPMEDAGTIQDQQMKSHVTRSVDKETSQRDRRRSRDKRGRRLFGKRKPSTQRPPLNFDDDTQSLLQKYKNDIAVLERIAGSGKTRTAVRFAINEILRKSKNLIHEVERATSSRAAKEALNTLGLLLTRVPLFEMNVAGFQRTKRAKRELFDESSLETENPLGKGFRQSDIKERRSSQKIKRDFVDAVRPRIFDRGGDSEDDSFYGFFETDPVEGFPTGDVFFETENYKRNFGGGSGIHREGDPAQDYGDPDDIVEPWMDDEGDYDFYQPREYFAGGRSGGVEPGELWEDEGADYGRLKNEDSKRQGDRGSLSRLTGYYEARQRRNFGNRQRRTLELKDPEFLMQFKDPEVRGVRRMKRKGSDLGAILDQEMIEEDDANSKDCNCRVIRDTDPCVHRRKRNVADTGSSLEIVSEQDETTDNDGIVPEEVEVFSELEGEPMAVLRAQSSKLKIERETVPEAFQVEESLSEPEVVSTRISEHAESQEGLEPLEVDDEATADSASLLNHEEDDLKSSRAVKRDRKGLFLGEDEKTEEKKEIDNHEAVEKSAASHGETSPTETINNDEEASGTKILSATLDPVALHEENVTQRTEDDDEDVKVAKGSSKRQADDDAQSVVLANAGEVPENVKVGSPKALRPIKKRLRIPISARGKISKILPWEKRVLDRARAMLALKKVADERKKRKLEESAVTGDAPARLLESQIERIRKRLRENHHRWLRLFRRKKLEEHGEHGKRLGRREAWQTIKDDEDLRDAMMMMHEPRRKERASETVDDDEDLSAMEVGKPRNIRERFSFLPRERRIIRDSEIMEHSNPREMQEGVIRLKDVLEKAVRGRVSDDRRDGQSYYALVESVEDPRFFHYPAGLQEEEDNNEQMITYPNSDSSEETYDLPRYRLQPDGLEILGSSEKYEDSGEKGLASSGEVYVIDPSTYRGGEPALQLYRQPSGLRNPGKSRIINLYNIQRARQNAYSKRKAKIADPESSEIRDEEEDAELDALIESLNSLSAAKLFSILFNKNDINKGKQNVRSIKEETTPAGEIEESLESAEDTEKGEVSEEQVSEESRQGEQEDFSGSSELVNIRNRRDIYDQSRLTRKQPREIKKTNKHNNARLEKSSLESPDDNSARIFKNEYDKAVSVKEPSSRRRISSKGVKFPSPSKLAEISEEHDDTIGATNTEELAKDPIEGAKDNLDLQSNQSGFMVMPWTRSLVRPKREAVDQEAEQVQVQHTEATTTEIPSSSESGEVEAAMPKKKPPKKYSVAGSLFNYLTGKKNLRKGGKEDLPSFIEASIPKVGMVVVDSLQKAQNVTGSVEQLIDDLEKRFESTTSSGEMIDDQSTGMTRPAFQSAITNVKKFFMVLAGIAHALRG
nr:uncharacterized protein LOC117223038 [Megalopta genalis]